MLVIKMVVALLIIVVCTLIGIDKSKKYETREYILREAVFLFRGIGSEIKYTLSTLPNAIESTRINMKTILRDVMGAVSTELLECNSSNEKIAKEISKLNELSPYDKQIIINGIVELGKTDIEGQMGIINMTCNSLESQLEESIESKRKNVKVFRTVGIAMGLIISIVFI